LATFTVRHPAPEYDQFTPPNPVDVQQILNAIVGKPLAGTGPWRLENYHLDIVNILRQLAIDAGQTQKETILTQIRDLMVLHGQIEVFYTP